MNVKAFSVFILSLLYLAIVLCGNPFKSVVWDDQKRVTIQYMQNGNLVENSNIGNGWAYDFPGNIKYDIQEKILTGTEDGVEYSIKFDFQSGKHSIVYSLTTKILMGTGISVTAVVIIGALYYFLSAPAPSPIDAAKEKKAKLPKKDSKSGKLPIKGKASKVKDSKDEKLPKK